MAQQNNPFMVTPGIAYAQPGLSAAIDQFGKMRQIQQLQGLTAAAASGDEQAYGQLLGLSPDAAKQARGMFVQTKAESLMGDSSLSDEDRFRQLAALDPTIANAYLKQQQDARKAAEDAQKAALEAKKETIAGGIRQLIPLQSNPELFKAKLAELQSSPDFVMNGRQLITAEDVADPNRVISGLPSLAAWALPKDEFAANFQTAQQRAELAQREEDAKLRRLAEENQREFQNQQLAIDRENLRIAIERGEREKAAALQARIDALEKKGEPYKADVPASMLNKATEYQRESTAAQDDAVKYAALLAKMNSPEVKGKLGGGWGGALRGIWATATGGQGTIDEVKAQLKQARVDATKLNLFTGPSTDKDVRLAMSPTFDENADEDVQRSVVAGLIKINQAKAAVNSFQSDWILRHGTVGGQADPKRDGFYFEAAPGVEIYVSPGEPYQRVLRRVKAVSLGEKDPNPPKSKASSDEEPLPPEVQRAAPPSAIPRTQAPINVGAPLPPAAPRPQGLRPSAQPAQAAKPAAARPAVPAAALTPKQTGAINKYLKQ